ncbi:Gag-pol Polyprotein [Phytophthora palmivora]|uniref:Gag-pol Polyprotein n=1 Tax=Phytophthora palmivora TaxID=4796 RepID=A0A2P4YD23_9STRA|nr:Gag-pol Polyprotein [Phytophthora palmivora]
MPGPEHNQLTRKLLLPKTMFIIANSITTQANDTSILTHHFNLGIFTVNGIRQFLALSRDGDRIRPRRTLYVREARCNLFSPDLALGQGFVMLLDQDAGIFGMTKDLTEAVHGNMTSKKEYYQTTSDRKFTVTDRVEGIDVWHELLGCSYPEYIRLLIDRGMAKVTILTKRGNVDRADCHIEKQRRKTYRKMIYREIERVHDLVYANLKIPGLHNGTQ